MSLIGRYHIMLTSDEYGSIIGRLKGVADFLLHYYEEPAQADRLRAIATELENHTTYIQEEEN